jgi:hypothetical protein
MRIVNIKDKLDEIECPVSSLSLGDFDYIGEYTAKKARNPTDPLYKSAGCYFRPNYERGLLFYSLVKRFDVKSFLEIGFGRGYVTFCVAKAMCDVDINDGKIYSVDPKFDENHLKMLGQIFPQNWFQKINLVNGTIDDALRHITAPVDMIYIDGDHRYDAVKHDWECVKDLYTKFVVFDDYDPKVNAHIQVKQFVDEISLDKELIVSDRRIFSDCRKIADEDMDYGQVLIKHPNFDDSSYLCQW